MNLLSPWDAPPDRGSDGRELIFDHWALLALAEAFVLITDAQLEEGEDAGRNGTVNRETLLVWAGRMALNELDDQLRDGSLDQGSFGAHKGMLCPAAIRVEGMLAFTAAVTEAALPPGAEAVMARDAVLSALPLSLEFMRRCQYTESDLATLGLPANAKVIAYRRSLFPNDNLYNPSTSQGNEPSKPLVDLGVVDTIGHLKPGFYYIWSPALGL